MNRLGRSVLGTVMVTILALVAADVLASEGGQTLRMTGSRWSPYIDESRPHNGLAAELVVTGLRRAGYALDPHLEAWPRALRGVEVGQYDVVAAIWRTPERDAELVFSEPYLMNDIVFLCRRGKVFPFESLENLAGKRIGVLTDYAYGGGFDDDPRIDKVVNNTLAQNLQLLRDGKLDLVVGDQWSIFYEITQFMPEALPEFDVLGRPLIRRGLRMGVWRQTPDHDQIVADFNAAMLE
ncbi:MAG: transporter substrate-binding domain-containing protein, partial [Gammaproteobacteria bacterium]